MSQPAAFQQPFSLDQAMTSKPATSTNSTSVDEFEVDADEWITPGNISSDSADSSGSVDDDDSSSVPVLPRTASDIDTLSSLAKAVDSRSPDRRKPPQKGKKLFAQLETVSEHEEPPPSNNGSGRRRKATNHAHTRSSSTDLTGLDLSALTLADVTGDDGNNPNVSLHADAATSDNNNNSTNNEPEPVDDESWAHFD